MPVASILLVDADPESVSAITPVLTEVGYTVTTVADAAEALAKVPEHGLVIIDVVAGSKTAVAHAVLDELVGLLADVSSTP